MGLAGLETDAFMELVYNLISDKMQLTDLSEVHEEWLITGQEGGIVESAQILFREISLGVGRVYKSPVSDYVLLNWRRLK